MSRATAAASLGVEGPILWTYKATPREEKEKQGGVRLVRLVVVRRFRVGREEVLNGDGTSIHPSKSSPDGVVPVCLVWQPTMLGVVQHG